MAANTAPIYTKVPQVGKANLSAANSTYLGDGTVATVFTAGLDGSYVSAIKVKPLGTNVATVLRAWMSTGDNSVTDNNVLIAEALCPATTASTTVGLPETVIPLNFAIPAGATITCALSVAVAAGLAISCYGGNY